MSGRSEAARPHDVEGSTTPNGLLRLPNVLSHRRGLLRRRGSGGAGATGAVLAPVVPTAALLDTEVGELFATPTTKGAAALSTRLACFFARPLVRCAVFVRPASGDTGGLRRELVCSTPGVCGFSPLASQGASLLGCHRREPAKTRCGIVVGALIRGLGSVGNSSVHVCLPAAHRSVGGVAPVCTRNALYEPS